MQVRAGSAAQAAWRHSTRSRGGAALLAGALLYACSAPQLAPPAPSGAIHASEEAPTFLSGPSVEPAVVAAIAAGIEAGRALRGSFGPLRVYVMDGSDDNTELLEDFCARARRPGEGRTLEQAVADFELPVDEGQIYSSIHHHSVEPFGAIVFLNFDSPAEGGRLAREARGAAVHEYTHVFQAAFQEPSGPPPENPQQQIPGPAWMIEGAATYLSITSAYEPELVARAQAQSAAIFRAAVRDHGVSLEDGETYDALGDGALVHAVLYEGGASAVKWLIDAHSEEAFWEGFYGAIPELGWDQAFEQSFGMTLAEFYDAFRAETP